MDKGGSRRGGPKIVYVSLIEFLVLDLGLKGLGPGLDNFA